MFGSCMKFHYFDQFQQSSNNFHINKTSVRVKNYLQRRIVSSVEMNSNSFPHLIQLSSTNLLLHGSKLSKEQLDNVRRVVVDSSTGLIFQFSPQLVFNLFDQHRLHFMFINLSKNRLEIFHFYFRRDLEFEWTVSHLIVTKLNNNLILYCFSGKMLLLLCCHNSCR